MMGTHPGTVTDEHLQSLRIFATLAQREAPTYGAWLKGWAEHEQCRRSSTGDEVPLEPHLGKIDPTLWPMPEIVSAACHAHNAAWSLRTGAAAEMLAGVVRTLLCTLIIRGNVEPTLETSTGG